jgi:ribosomal protein S6
VGEIYENRLGEYKVLDIDRANDWVALRYVDTGERLESTITLQKRIYRNIMIQRRAQKERRKKKRRKAVRGYGKNFEGLTENEFSTSIRGTSWRRRKQLPGAVARLVTRNVKQVFTSWAVPYTPVAYIAHRDEFERGEKEHNRKLVRYTIELDDHAVYYGLYIRSTEGAMDETWDWTRLMPALREDDGLQATIDEAEQDYNAAFLALEGDEDTNTFREALDEGERFLWETDAVEEMGVEERIKKLDDVPAVEVYIMTSIPRDEAIDMGPAIANEIADFYDHLWDLYRVASG